MGVGGAVAADGDTEGAAGTGCVRTGSGSGVGRGTAGLTNAGAAGCAVRAVEATTRGVGGADVASR